MNFGSVEMYIESVFLYERKNLKKCCEGGRGNYIGANGNWWLIVRILFRLNQLQQIFVRLFLVLIIVNWNWCEFLIFFSCTCVSKLYAIQNNNCIILDSNNKFSTKIDTKSDKICFFLLHKKGKYWNYFQLLWKKYHEINIFHGLLMLFWK